MRDPNRTRARTLSRYQTLLQLQSFRIVTISYRMLAVVFLRNNVSNNKQLKRLCMQVSEGAGLQGGALATGSGGASIGVVDTGEQQTHEQVRVRGGA